MNAHDPINLAESRRLAAVGAAVTAGAAAVSALVDPLLAVAVGATGISATLAVVRIELTRPLRATARSQARGRSVPR